MQRCTLQLSLESDRISILLVIAAGVTASISLLGVLPLDAARPAATERRLETEVNVLLRIQTDDERGNVDNLIGEKCYNVKTRTVLQIDTSTANSTELFGHVP